MIDPDEYRFLEEDSDRPRRTKERPSYQVVYEDESIIVFDKASGVATIPERYREGVSLKEIAEEKFGRLWTVHRIDKATSGVVLFARDAESHKALNDQFEHREVTKIYAAFLEGEIPQDEIRIDIPISVDPADKSRMRPSARGKASITVLQLRERFRGFTYVEARPETGRQHQIRVHCTAVGLPLLVDPVYGNHSEFMLSSIKKKFRDYGRTEHPLVDRLTLHAESLRVVHPGTGSPITFTAELPKDLHALLTQMRKLRSIPDR